MESTRKPTALPSSDANILDAIVYVDFKFSLSDALFTGDKLNITMPGFKVLNQLDPDVAVTTVTSSISLSGRWNLLTQTLEMTVNTDWLNAAATMITLRVIMRSPSTSINTNIHFLSIISMSKGPTVTGSIFNTPMVSVCNGFCNPNGIATAGPPTASYSTAFLGQPVTATLAFTHTMTIPINGDLKLFLSDLEAVGLATSISGYVEILGTKTSFTNAIQPATANEESYITLPVPVIVAVGTKVIVVVNNLLYKMSTLGLQIVLTLPTSTIMPRSSQRFPLQPLLPDISKADIRLTFDVLNNLEVAIDTKDGLNYLPGYVFQLFLPGFSVPTTNPVSTVALLGGGVNGVTTCLIDCQHFFDGLLENAAI